MDKINIVSVNANFLTKECEVKCELLSDFNGFEITKGTVKVSIPKLYSSINSALNWEVATKLKEGGFDVEVPTEPEEGVL